MLPEIEEFYSTLEGSNEYYDAQRKVESDNPVGRWNSQWGAEKRAEWYALDKKRADATLEFRHTTRERHHVAEQVLKTHSDPVIKWLMTERLLGDYTGYRDEVLKALPMTRDEIETFGDRKGWCGEYSRMLDRAEKAGILPPAAPDLADIDALVRELSDTLGNSQRRYSGMIRKHLPAIIASYQERQAAQEKATEETPVKPKRVARKKAADPAAPTETVEMPVLIA